MINARILQRATVVGTVLQLIMVVAGHFLPWIRDNAFMFGGMLISGVAGLLYARDAALGYGRGALGGAIAGGLGALIGIGVSVLLGDTLFSILALGTAISIVTGAAGGLWGQFGVFLKSRLG
ncbi:MAG TPA: hypothetical protein VHE09_14825 [Rhizomicrobium sp.]|jgi:hypothetical protein|nr:hypothetical protein [Rhizomicrobium sp.]